VYITGKIKIKQIERCLNFEYLYCILRNFWVVLSWSWCCQNTVTNKHCFSVSEWQEWCIAIWKCTKSSANHKNMLNTVVQSGKVLKYLACFWSFRNNCLYYANNLFPSIKALYEDIFLFVGMTETDRFRVRFKPRPRPRPVCLLENYFIIIPMHMMIREIIPGRK